jgi:hypothetical protein
MMHDVQEKGTSEIRSTKSETISTSEFQLFLVNIIGVPRCTVLIIAVAPVTHGGNEKASMSFLPGTAQ